jgi:hypothetical protein
MIPARRATVLAAAVALAGLVGSGLSFGARAQVGPKLLRDTQAARNLLTPPAPTVAQPDIIQPDTQIEPSIAVNPSNPLNAVAGFQEGRVSGGGDETNGYATTFDGGKTWKFGEAPCLTKAVPGPGCPHGGPFDRASDAAVAFGPKSTVYLNSLVFNDTGGGNRSGISVNVSYDGGKTWSAPVVFQDDNLGGLNDKNWIVVDNGTGPGHKPGRVYAVWDRVIPVVYNYCDSHCDQKSHWLPSFLTITALQGIGTIPLVLNDGSLGVAYVSLTAVPVGLPGGKPDICVGCLQVVWALAPAAGRLPWPAPLSFTQTTITVASDTSNPQRYQRGSDGLISASVDASTGKIYIAWDDGRSRTEKPKVVNDPLIVASNDSSGLTWGKLTRVDAHAPTNDYVNRYGVMVAAASGVVHLAYRQRQEDADPKGNGSTFSPIIDTYYTESRDGGATFTAPIKVDTQPTNFYYGAFSRGGLFQGDYDQLAVGGTYTYIAREEAFPLDPNEPHGLAFSAASSPHYEGNYSECPQKNGKPVVTPSCLKHLHQRTWVAVVTDTS